MSNVAIRTAALRVLNSINSSLPLFAFRPFTFIPFMPPVHPLIHGFQRADGQQGASTGRPAPRHQVDGRAHRDATQWLIAMGPPLRRACVAAALILAGCSSFHYEKLSPDGYRATHSAAWLTEEPDRPYTIIARFEGAETSLCPTSQPYCSLHADALRYGADAIWIQRRQPGSSQYRWVMINGKMTRILDTRYERIEGVLIRYP